MIDQDFWQGKRVFLTGHTGFKGGWLASWLTEMGACVTGFGLAPDTEPSFYHRCEVGRRIERSVIGDVRDFEHLSRSMAEAAPDLVFHLAAQALVGRSYRQPVETYSTNIMGTVHVLEAVRACPSVRAAVVVTSDKVYDNRNWVWSYREDEPFGGHDPYSSSKGCAELVTAAYRRSFFSAPEAPAIATARAGNVIGGGDWSENRIVPDAARSFLNGEPLLVRNPASVRPWQHVLDALSGYLTLAQALWWDGRKAAQGWNFGPSDDHSIDVATLAGMATRLWPGARWVRAEGAPAFSEDRVLKLDSAKAREFLGWRGRLSLEATLAWTLDWYRQAAEAPETAIDLAARQISDYQSLPVGTSQTAAAVAL